MRTSGRPWPPPRGKSTPSAPSSSRSPTVPCSSAPTHEPRRTAWPVCASSVTSRRSGPRRLRRARATGTFPSGWSCSGELPARASAGGARSSQPEPRTTSSAACLNSFGTRDTRSSGPRPLGADGPRRFSPRALRTAEVGRRRTRFGCGRPGAPMRVTSSPDVSAGVRRAPDLGAALSAVAGGKGLPCRSPHSVPSPCTPTTSTICASSPPRPSSRRSSSTSSSGCATGPPDLVGTQHLADQPEPCRAERRPDLPGHLLPARHHGGRGPAGRARAGAAARRRTRGRRSGRLQRQGDGRRRRRPLQPAVLLHRRAAARQRQGVLRRCVRRADRHPGRGRRAVPDAADHRRVRRGRTTACRARTPNARTMANDAVTLANADVDFTPVRQRRQRLRRRVHRGARRAGRRGDGRCGRHLVAQVGAAQPSDRWTARRSSPT